MKAPSHLRVFQLLGLVSLLLGVLDWLYPVSTMVSRLGGVLLFGFAWVALLTLAWSRRGSRYSLLGTTALGALFLALPARNNRDPAALRQAYVAGLCRYEGATYSWGGESPLGIDCSGLIRRGLIDSLFLEAVRTLDPGLARQSLSLWWHDCSARQLGEGGGLATPLGATPSLNALDPARLLPGDLAVTKPGIHILAYLGENRWAEADPGVHRVVIVTTPSENDWFKAPMNLVRWNVLQP